VGGLGTVFHMRETYATKSPDTTTVAAGVPVHHVRKSTLSVDSSVELQVLAAVAEIDAARSASKGSSPSPAELTDRPTGNVIVEALRRRLNLDPTVDWQLGVLRVSTKGDLRKLASQESTGIRVFDEDPDFQSLAGNDRGFADRDGWHELTYRDVHPEGKTTRFGWYGIVGRTIFLAVPDSAIEYNLPPDPADPAQLGRNAFTTAFVALAIAVNATDILVPFFSRWWRDNLLGATIVKSLTKVLPHCRLWSGKQQVRLDADGQMVTFVEGSQAQGYGLTLKTQSFAGLVRAAMANGWGRAERELPLGLRRERINDVGGDRLKLGTAVEFHPARLTIAQTALQMLAAGKSYKEVGAHLAEQKVPMPGTQGAGKTFADYSSDSARTTGVKNLLLDSRALAYYRTGQCGVELQSSGILDSDKSMRGISVQFDHATRMHVWKGTVIWPHQPMLTSDEWAKLDQRLTDEAEHRNRLVGAAAQEKHTASSAFQGVTAWDTTEGREAKLAPETDTAYRWRERDRAARGWQNNEGDPCATLRKAFFDRAAGQAIIDAIRGLSAPIATLTPSVGHDPVKELRAEVAELTAAFEQATKATKRAEEELLRADDEDDQQTWRQLRSKKKADAKRIDADLTAARARLADAAANIVLENEDADADVTLPALVGSLLLDSDGTVPPAVVQGLHTLGVTSTLRLAFEDPTVLPAYQRPDSERGDLIAERWVTATATMTVTFVDGSTFDVPLTWRTLDTWTQTGTRSMTHHLIRLWAAGKSIDGIAALSPGMSPKNIRHRLVSKMRAAGMDGWYLPGTAVECEVLDTRRVIAAKLTDDPTLTDGLTSEFIKHIESAYFDPSEWNSKLWCDRAGQDDVRRVLAVFAAATPAVWRSGLPTDAVARLAGLSRADVRRFGRQLGVVELTDHHTVAPVLCATCAVPLTIYNPCPETGRTGLVCATCTRPPGIDAMLGVEYTRSWTRTTEGYVEAATPTVGRPSAVRDVTLSVSDFARRLGVPAHAVREWDKRGTLVPHTRTSHGDRLYLEPQLDAATPLADEWRANWGTDSDMRGGDLTTGEAASILGVSSKQVRTWSGGLNPRLPIAGHTPGGHRLFRRCDVDALKPTAQAMSQAADLCTVGEMAAEFGLKPSTLRHLADSGQVPFVADDREGGWRRFDRDAVKVALEQLDLIGSQDLITIGQLQAHSGIHQSTLRTMADGGVLPVAAVSLGGTRKFDLTVALAALAQAGFDKDGTQHLTCETCHATFARANKRGPKPRKCEPCQTA
jgi:DNA-binding transcriptional MerR regulator